MHLDQHLVILWNRFLDLLEFKNIGRTVSRAHDCLHELPPDPPAQATDARADALNPLAMSQIARTTSCNLSGACTMMCTLSKGLMRSSMTKRFFGHVRGKCPQPD